LHLKSLTRCDLPGLLDLLEGDFGLIPCGLRALTSLGEFDLLSRRIILQGLAFFDCILKFLLDFFDPGLELLTGGQLLDSLIFGLAQGFLQGLDFSRRSCSYYSILVSTQHLRSLNTQ
jgi:hypothetical protein